MPDPFESRSPNSQPPDQDNTWQELRARYQRLESDEDFVKSLKQISVRVPQPTEKRRKGFASAPWFGFQLSSGQWIAAAATLVLLVACGISYIAILTNPFENSITNTATNAKDPTSPFLKTQPQPSNSEPPTEAELAEPRSSPEISSELAVARLVFAELNKRARPDRQTRWEQLRKERGSVEEAWERVGATLTYAADYETERNQERAAHSPDTPPQESIISPLYQVVIDVAPTSHWSQEARARFEKLQ